HSSHHPADARLVELCGLTQDAGCPYSGNGDRCGRFPGICMTKPGPCPWPRAPLDMSHYDCARPALRLGSSITRDAKSNAASQLGRSDDVSEGSKCELARFLRQVRYSPNAKHSIVMAIRLISDIGLLIRPGRRQWKVRPAES